MPADPPGHPLGDDADLRLLVESVEDYAIFMLDPDGRVVTWNRGAQRMKGYLAEEIIGRSFSLFYPAEDVAAGKPGEILQTAISHGRHEAEGWRMRADGTRFWANVVVTALRDPEGRLRGFAKVTRDLTERRRAEETTRRLRDQEIARETAEANLAEVERARKDERRRKEELRVTLASIGDAVIVTDDRGVVTFLNAVAEALMGWKDGRAIGRPLEEVFVIVNERTRRPVENPVVKVLETGTVVGLANHTILLSRDGREIPIDDSGAPIRDESGRTLGVVLVFRDVTEARRGIEAELRLAAIARSTEDAIVGIDLAGTIETLNEGGERMLGVSAAELTGRAFATLFAADHVGEADAMMARLETGEALARIDTVWAGSDGRRLDVSLSLSPMRDDEGTIVGIAAIARDVGDAKRAERALRFLAEAARLLTGLVDVSGRLEKLVELAVPQFADWCVLDLVSEGRLHPAAAAHVDPARIERLRQMHRAHPVAPDGLPDASSLEAIMSAARRPMLDELGTLSHVSVPLRSRGELAGVLTFGTAESGRVYDQTDRRSAEDLAHRVAVAIENARLYDELQATDRRKDELLAMLAHELRNPLAAIRNATALLGSPRDAAAAEKARGVVERQVEWLTRLVSDLVDVSRIRRGVIELRKEPVDLADAIGHACEMVQPFADSRGQRVEIARPDRRLIVDADPVRIAQIFANILHNAAKYSRRPGTIRVTTAVEGHAAVVRVRDEGDGISADLLPRIFELFVQGDRSRGIADGMGIGLTVVRDLVAMHGGSVRADSEGPGKGAEIAVRLPLSSLAAGASRAARALATTSGPNAKRVLIVDDNPDLADTTALLVEGWGHDTRVAYDGTHAVALARDFRPEIILLDIAMPELDGYEVARRLQAQRLDPTPLLVAITGFGQDLDRDRTKDAGFQHHLIKPVPPDVLRGLLAGDGSPAG